jgi:hypothetical protein
MSRSSRASVVRQDRGRRGRTTLTALTVIPSAKRLTGSLRDLGYDFVHAVADLIDNSISAGASRVDIDLRFEGPESWVRIADNGSGMSAARLTEALRFGTRRSYELSDLGKFGLGLKTASLSQARRLLVATRTSASRERISARMLDLDHIEDSDSWEILSLPRHHRSATLVEPLGTGPGTVVLWERLDRVFSYRVPGGERARVGFHLLAERLDAHLGMVFHRFLAGEARRRRKLVLRINGVPVEAWDPFARDEPATRALEVRRFEVDGESSSGSVTFQPFVLPPRDTFSSEHNFHRLSGPGRWNRQQGLYIYRGDRMLQSGGWSYLRTADEHTKLARAAIDFAPDLDGAFRVNVVKARVLLPPSLREQLEPAVAELVQDAQIVYRGNGGRSSRSRAKPGGDGDDQKGNTSSPRQTLERAAAQVGELTALRRIAKELRRVSPDIARRLGW